VVVEVWNVGAVAQDTANVIIVNMEDLRARMENMELVEMEVDQWMVQLKWDLANTCQDIAILVSEQEQMGEQWTQIRDMVVKQTGLIHDLTNFMELIRD